MKEKQQQKTKSRYKANEKARSSSSEELFGHDALPSHELDVQPENKTKKSELHVTSRKATRGKDDESNIKIQTFSVPVGRNISAYDIVTTKQDNGLHVFVKQGRYKKEYEGVGKIKTSILPVAPVGMKGVLKATDRSTGETLELEWQWQRLFSLPSIWKKIKSLILKEEV